MSVHYLRMTQVVDELMTNNFWMFQSMFTLSARCLKADNPLAMGRWGRVNAGEFQ